MTASQRNGKQGSRNPAKKATSVSSWKKSATSPPIELPSGNYMSIKKIGLQALIRTGVMPNSLMNIAKAAVEKGESGKVDGLSEEAMMELLGDQEKVQQISDFMDQVLILCAQEPTVHPAPLEGVERDDEVLYVDEVDEEDKMFVFQVVTGGTTNVEAFRQETGTTMAAIRRRQDLELPAK